MKPEDQIKALSELDEALFVIHKPIHDPFGYYRKEACGYTILSEAWRVTEEVGLKYIGGRSTDHDRVILEPAPTKPYTTSFDAIIPLIQKRWRSHTMADGTKWQLRFWKTLGEHECMLFNSPSKLCEALLCAEEKWS